MEFTKIDIKSQIQKALDQRVLFDSISFLSQNEFSSPASEQFLYAITGSKTEFNNLLSFWIKALKKIFQLTDSFEGELDYLEWFEVDNSISNFDVFNSFITQLKTEIKVIDSPTKVYRQFNSWDKTSYLLENKNQFMLIIWETTA
jgi:hypothetical protein